MKTFKGLSAMLFLFALLLTGCESVETGKIQSNTNKPKTNPPTRTPDNHADDNAKRVTIEEARAIWEKDKDGVIFIDTRSEAAYEASHIKGAFLLNDFLSRASSVPKDKTIITYCT